MTDKSTKGEHEGIRVVNLRAECGPLPGGAELASNYGGNLTLTVEGVLSWTEPMRWGIRIEKPTKTASGRRGKPKRVVLLVAGENQTIPEMLRSIAAMWEQGDVIIGEDLS